MSYRVAFHWSETTACEGGRVPVTLTEPLRLHEVAMRGTNARSIRCTALAGTLGVDAQCSIHGAHPSCCREVAVGGDQCQRARAQHGLPPVAAIEVVQAYACANPPAVLADVLDCAQPIVALTAAVAAPDTVATTAPASLSAKIGPWVMPDESGPRMH